jgi:hypothetical protein
VGVDAGKTNMGNYNTFVGVNAGSSTLNADANSFLGYQAGASNTTGNYNTFVGNQAGYSNTTAAANVFVGDTAGYENTTGKFNTIVGGSAGVYNQTGTGNAIVGYWAGFGDTDQSFSSSTLIGRGAGFGLTTGNDNIFVGFNAGDSVTSGTGNIVIGYNKNTSAPTSNNELNIGGVLYGNLSAKTIGISTRVPQAALDVVSTGATNVEFAQIWRDSGGVIKASMSATGVMQAVKFIGDGSGLTTVSGDNLGNHTATTVLQMGNYSINSSSSITAARYQIAGSTVLAILSGVGSLGVGVAAGMSATGDYNVFVGKDAGSSTTNTGANNSFVGAGAGYNNSVGFSNSYFGSYSGYTNTGGDLNTFMGYNSGNLNTADANTFLGAYGGAANTTGAYNSFVGAYAGYNNNTGADNTFVGYNAGRQNNSPQGANNSFVGSNAGRWNGVGKNNSLMGYYAAFFNQTGSANSILGAEAGGYNGGSGSGSFSSSTLMGYQAGTQLTTGYGNIFIGFKAGYDVNTGIGNIVIGYNKTTSAVGANNELNIGDVVYGDLSAKTIGISTRVPQAALDVVSTGTANTQMAQLWRDSGGVIVGSMSATGVMQAVKFVGSAAGLTGIPGDNLGNHTATTRLQMGTYGINTSSSVTAVRYQINGSTVVAVLSGTGSFGIGVDAGRLNTGTSNSFMGYHAGYANTAATASTYVGSYAGEDTTGGANSFVGAAAGRYSTTGSANAYLGTSAGVRNESGSANVIVGGYAGLGVSGHSFSSSTIVGYMSGYSLQNGSADNIFLGWKAGYAVTTGTGNIVIGYDKGTSAAGANNELNIGDLVYGDLSAKTVGINRQDETDVTLAVGGPAGSNTYAAKFYSGASLAAWIKKK